MTDVTKPRTKVFRAVLYTLCGFVWAVGTYVLSLLLTGAGHGWSSGTFCWLAVFILPFYGIALVYKNSSMGLAILTLALLGLFCVDVFIINATLTEDPNYLAQAWKHIPLLLLAWTACWFGPQAFAILEISRAVRARIRRQKD